MLFGVTTRGRARIFNKPRDSAMVRIASSLTALLAFTKLRPLVGPLAARFENCGICTPVPGLGAEVPMSGYSALRVLKTDTGDALTELAPPRPFAWLPPPKRNWEPVSRASVRVVASRPDGILSSWVCGV